MILRGTAGISISIWLQKSFFRKVYLSKIWSNVGLPIIWSLIMSMKTISIWVKIAKKWGRKTLWKYLFPSRRFSWIKYYLSKKKGNLSKLSKFASRAPTSSKNLKTKVQKKSKIAHINMTKKFNWQKLSYRKFVQKMSSLFLNYWNLWIWSRDWPIFCSTP